MKKKLLSVALCTAMLVPTLAGCGGGAAEEAPAAAEEAPAAATDGEPVTLTVLAGQSTTDAGIEEMIDEALAKAYPNITLEWECVDWGNDFQPKMQQYMQ